MSSATRQEQARERARRAKQPRGKVARKAASSARPAPKPALRLDEEQARRIVEETRNVVEAHIAASMEPYSVAPYELVLADVIKEIADRVPSIAPAAKKAAALVGGVSARSWKELAEKHVEAATKPIKKFRIRMERVLIKPIEMPQVVYEDREVKLDEYARQRLESASKDHWKWFDLMLTLPAAHSPQAVPHPSQKAPLPEGSPLGRAETTSAHPQKGRSMRNRTPEDPQDSRVFVDVTPVADRTFGEVFKMADVAADEVGQRLWDFLLTNGVQIEVEPPLDPGTDIRSLLPRRVTDEELDKLDGTDQTLERGKTYTFSDLYKTARIDFGSVLDERLGPVLGAGRQTQASLFGKLWKYIEARGLRRHRR